MTNSMLFIGALAGQAGVNVDTIRFYQRKGIVPLPPRPERGARRYSRDYVAPVRFIKAAQSWGFTLSEVADLLRLEDGLACDAARRIAEDRLAVVTGRMRELRQAAGALRGAIADCQARRGRVSCPLISSLRRSGPRGGAFVGSARFRR